MEKYGVYGWFDRETNQCLYVGQGRLEERYLSHIKTLKSGRHKRKELVEWFRGHDSNFDSMICMILEFLPHDETLLNRAEIKWFHELSPLFYDKEPSIHETWCHSVETRQKIADAIRIKSGNSTGVNAHISNMCSFCHRESFLSYVRKTPLCHACKIYQEDWLFQILWEETIVSSFLKGKSLRKIAAENNIQRKAMTKMLKRIGYDIQPGGQRFTGGRHSDESKRKISTAGEKAGLNVICNNPNCLKSFRTKPSRPQKFCSRTCYLNKI